MTPGLANLRRGQGQYQSMAGQVAWRLLPKVWRSIGEATLSHGIYRANAVLDLQVSSLGWNQWLLLGQSGAGFAWYSGLGAFTSYVRSANGSIDFGSHWLMAIDWNRRYRIESAIAYSRLLEQVRFSIGVMI